MDELFTPGTTTQVRLMSEKLCGVKMQKRGTEFQRTRLCETFRLREIQASPHSDLTLIDVVPLPGLPTP
jgi:hypothetical protein